MAIKTAIHAHGVVRLKNDPGISDLVEIVYKGRLSAENLKNFDFLIDHTDDQLYRYQMVVDGVAAQRRVITYVDTIQTAINPRTDRNLETCVPDPHPCSIDIANKINDSDFMDND